MLKDTKLESLLDGKKVWCLIDPETRANNNIPNVGLAHLSATFQQLRIPHQIVDHDIRPYPKRRYLKTLGKADVMGISVKCNTLEEAKNITRWVAIAKPTMAIVWGGPHVVKENIPDLQEEFPSVIFEEGLTDQKLLIGPEPRVKLDQLPFQSYERFDSLNYLEEQFKCAGIPYPLITSRGCPSRCLYCHCSKYFNARTPRHCIDELKEAKTRFKIKNFFILDDNFILLHDRAMEFCSLLGEVALPWACPNGLRADHLTKELAKRMKETGCYHISIGVESSDPEVLKAIKKGETIEQIEKAIRIAKGVGLSVNGFFIIGLPGSSYEKDYESYLWSKRMDIQAHFNILGPIPGTEIWRDYQDCIIKENVSKALFFDDKGSIEVAFETPEYPASQRKELYERINRESGRWQSNRSKQ